MLGTIKALQLQPARPQAPEARLFEPGDSPGRLDVRTDVESLGKPEFATGTEKKRVDVLVIVTGAEPAQDHPTLVRLIIAIGVLQKQQLGTVANVSAAIAQLDAGGNHQAVREDDRLVATPIAVRVFEDKHLVVRRLPRFDLGIDRAADNPQTPACVETDLDRFHDAVLLRGKEIHLKTVGYLERGQFSDGIVGQERSSKYQTPNSK